MTIVTSMRSGVRGKVSQPQAVVTRVVWLGALSVRLSRGGFAAAVCGALLLGGRTWGGGALMVRVGARHLTM
jgi:hypothetical protein